MDTEKINYGWVILIFLFFIFFSNGAFGFGNNNRGYNVGNVCQDISNCDVRVQEIADTAKTQFLINQRNGENAILINNSTQALSNKMDTIAYENLKDQLQQERTKNVVLENRLYADRQYNELTAQNTALATSIAELSCRLPQRPPYYSCGYVPCGTLIPQPCTTPAVPE